MDSSLDPIISILIADDHPVMRLGLNHLIQSQPGMEVVGAVGDGAEALQLIAQLKPQLLILDVDMPGMNGLQLMQQLHSAQADLKIIIFTAHHDKQIFDAAISAGIPGFISKENVFTDLVEGIRQVMAGQNYFSPVFSNYLLSRIQSNDDRQHQLTEKESVEHLLTLMERRVIRLIAESKTSQDIAELLFISGKTVENHRTNICRKLNLRGKNSLLKFALENKHLWNERK